MNTEVNICRSSQSSTFVKASTYLYTLVARLYQSANPLSGRFRKRCQSDSHIPTDLESTQSDSQSPIDLESTQSQNIGNARTKFLYVHKIPICSRLLDGHSILYSNSRTRCKYVALFLWPVNAVLIMLLITYFTTDRLLLSTFVFSVINNIITTPQGTDGSDRKSVM